MTLPGLHCGFTHSHLSGLDSPVITYSSCGYNWGQRAHGGAERAGQHIEAWDDWEKRIKRGIFPLKALRYDREGDRKGERKWVR